MLVDLHWDGVDGDDHEGWSQSLGVYAYQHPRAREILYVGKADGCTVRERWRAPDKDALWDALERQRGIKGHRVLVGTFATEHRLTRELVADVESLLIMAIQPWGNILSTRSRISRPGLVVRNRGTDWPGPRKVTDGR